MKRVWKNNRDRKNTWVLLTCVLNTYLHWIFCCPSVQRPGNRVRIRYVDPRVKRDITYIHVIPDARDVIKKLFLCGIENTHDDWRFVQDKAQGCSLWAIAEEPSAMGRCARVFSERIPWGGISHAKKGREDANHKEVTLPHIDVIKQLLYTNPITSKKRLIESIEYSTLVLFRLILVKR